METKKYNNTAPTRTKPCQYSLSARLKVNEKKKRARPLCKLVSTYWVYLVSTYSEPGQRSKMECFEK